MASASDPIKGYPKLENVSEQRRLHANQDLVANAFGSRLLCPVDLQRSGLHILDSATSDGYWLQTIHALLKDPASARMIGTDIAPPMSDSARGFTPPPNMTFQQQDLRQDWPSDWSGSFDVVSQRLALFAAGSFDGAVAAVGRMLRLLKPGGWIVLVEGVMPKGPVGVESLPHQKVLAMLGDFAEASGMDPTGIPPRLKEILEAAIPEAGDEIEMHDISYRQVSVRYGAGSQAEMHENGMIQAVGLSKSLDWLKANMGEKVPMLHPWNESLRDDFLKETAERGFDMMYHAVWAQRLDPEILV